MKKIKEQIIEDFDPNGVGVENGNFIGLPFDMDNSEIIIYTVPWDVTVSFSDGTSEGPINVLNSSYQLDLYLEEFPDLWKKGIYFIPPSEEIKNRNKELRKKAKSYISFLENGSNSRITPELKNDLSLINDECFLTHEFIENSIFKLLKKGKKIALLGGDHSTPFGYIKALGSIHKEFGILQIDAHCDLRKAYEGFIYSHASIFYNVLNEIPQVKQLTQIGIRDYCEEEAIMAKNDSRINLFSDKHIRNKLFNGEHWKKIVEEIISTLPKKVYISFDIDGLDPSLCPNTGTPVPGGFSYNEIIFLIKELRKSDKEIIGFDLNEVAGEGDLDGNVAARILYQLMTLFY